MDILIHEPEGDEEYFDSFEILRKIGGLESKGPWQSVVNLTDGERTYEMEGVETSMKHAVTVRGLVLPDSFSEMADPLVFETMEAGLSPFHSPPVLLMRNQQRLNIHCVSCSIFCIYRSANCL